MSTIYIVQNIFTIIHRRNHLDTQKQNIIQTKYRNYISNHAKIVFKWQSIKKYQINKR